MILGEPNKLQFEFLPSNRDQALGLGSLRAFIGDKAIWSDEAQRRGISWTWIDLLEQLARSWSFLEYDEATPLGVTDWQALLKDGRITPTEYDFAPVGPESTRESYIFVRRHNLATGVEGLYLPSLSLLREGRKMWVVSSVVTKLFEAAATLRTLALLGDALAAHVESGAQDHRSRLAIEAWRNREPTSETRFKVRLGSNYDLREIIPRGETLAAYLEAENGDFESSLLVAARMSQAVPLESRQKILEALRELPAKGVSSKLQELSVRAQNIVPEFAHRAFEQGATLAKWARKEFGIAPEEKADAQGILRGLGVDVRLSHFGTDTIDAVGCWGHNHGPAVLVNLDGEHAQADAGRRTTFAHELAHVLFDRDGSLPAAEVLGGNGPRYPEQRANAFAAEFLLPKSIVVQEIRDAEDQFRVIKRLRVRYDVSQEVAAWQILNSGVGLNLNSEARELVHGWSRRGGLWRPAWDD